MPDDLEPRLTLRQADQARTDFAPIESDLDAMMARIARLPTCGDLAKNRAPDHRVDGSACHSVGRSVLAPMMQTTTVPGADHYREIAGMLREAARSCQFAGARKEILDLAASFESRAHHLDRRGRINDPNVLGAIGAFWG